MEANGRRTGECRQLDAEPSPERPPRPALNDIPEELLEQVACHLNTIGLKHWQHDDIQPIRTVWRPRYLHPFSLVSTKFHRVGTPLLYSIFVNDDSPVALLQFLRTIIRNPHLAACIRTVIIGDFAPENHVLPIEGQAELSANILARAREVNLGRDIWLGHLERGYFEAEIAFLLTQAPNLDTLDLEVGERGIHEQYAWTFSLLQAIASDRGINRAQSLPRNLRHAILRDVTLEVTKAKVAIWGPDEPPKHSFDNFLRLPSLRTFELHDILRLSTHLSSWPVNSANIDTLITKESTLPPPLLTNLARACQQLKHLAYQFGRPEERGGPLDVEEVRHAALMHKDSLKTLVLETKTRARWLPSVSAIGTLKSLTNLRHLTISGVLLFNNLKSDSELPRPDSVPGLLGSQRSPSEDFFPPYLQTLCIDLYSTPISRAKEIFNVITCLASRGSDVLPGLHHLQLTIPTAMWDEPKDEQSDLWLEKEEPAEWREKFEQAAVLMMDRGMDQFTIRVLSDGKLRPKVELDRAYFLRRDVYDKKKTCETGTFEWHHCFRCH